MLQGPLQMTLIKAIQISGPLHNYVLLKNSNKFEIGLQSQSCAHCHREVLMVLSNWEKI